MAPFVGRAEQLARLRDLLHRAGRGGRELAVVAGDPGVGKTRICAELAAEARPAGWTVLYGHVQAEAVLPFQPFVEALRHHVAHAPPDELRELAEGPLGPELARLLPELRAHMPGLAEPRDDDDADTARYRLFEAIARAITGIAGSRPLLLVLDDLHWADPPTLLLLEHLLASEEQAPLLVVCALRGSEPPAAEATLAGLADRHGAAAVGLAGLSDREVRKLVSEWSEKEPPAGFVEELVEETDGNPFFVREILRHLHESGALDEDLPERLSLASAGIPEGVREVLGRRLARLGEDTARVLELAAVIGREFDDALLTGASGLGAGELASALAEAEAARLVAPAGDGRHAFSHALVRDALYDELSSTRRMRLHRRVGEVLEELSAADPGPALAQLADHFLASALAGDGERAVGYASRAAERALSQLAYEEAARLYERALDVLPEDGGARRCDLLLALGAAHSRAGATDRARAAFRRAAALAERLGDAPRLEAAAIGYAHRFVEEPGVVDRPLIELLEQAFAAAPGEDRVARVRLLGHLCGALYYAHEHDRIDRCSREALAIAERLGDDEALAYAHVARRRALWRPEHLGERLAAATAAVHHAEAAESRELALQGHGWLVVDLLEAGDVDGVAENIGAFERGAAGLRQPLYEWNLKVWSAMRALLAGEFPRAEELAAEALAAGQGAESLTAPHYYAVQLLALRREQGRLPELEGAAREFVSRYPAIPAWRSALATICVEAGKHDDAVAEFETLAAHDFEDMPRDGNWLIGVTLAADVCTTLGDARRAELLYELLLPYADAVIVVALAAVCYGSAARYLGALAATAGRDADARRHFEEALARNAAIGSPPLLARTQAGYAPLLAATDRERALEMADAAHATAERLGMPRLAGLALSARRAAEAQAAR